MVGRVEVNFNVGLNALSFKISQGAILSLANVL
jgi:hypothetical protein